MFDFKVKQLGFSKDINDPLYLKPINIPIGEWWSLTIPKSSLPSCKLKLATIKNLGTVDDIDCECSIELNKIISKSCVYRLPNDEKAYISVTIIDKEVIPAFNIIVDEYEILEFEGGTIEDLLTLIDAMNLGQEELGYGVKIYFDKSFNGKTASIYGTDNVYLLNERFCLNYSKYIGVDFSFCEVGCHRLGFINDNGDIVAFANQFNVVKNADRKTKMIEYTFNDFYHRHRVELGLNIASYPIEEEQKTLSTGDISIYNIIVRTQRDFYTGLLEHQEHLRLLAILKNGIKVDGKPALMVGAYGNDSQGFSEKSIGSGTLNFKDEVYKNTDLCLSGCLSGSTFRFEVFETEKVQTLLG